MTLTLIHLAASVALNLAAANPSVGPAGASSHEAFDDPAKAFQAAKQMLMEKYVREDVTEAELYRAAVEGMLEHIDAKYRTYNTLLSPTDVSELRVDLQGHIVGVGVQLKLDPSTGVADVQGVVVGSPAALAGLQVGDKVLAVDGQSFKGKAMADLVNAIRGAEGTSVRFDVLRDTQVFQRELRREKVSLALVSHQRFPGDIELLTLRGFSENTPELLRTALTEISHSGAKGLIIDLRSNPGGLLDQAITSARMLLPRGSTIAQIVHRGHRVETLTATGDPILAPLPTAVLVGGGTMSSAEVIAAALRAGLHAPLMGATTRGKWSVQSLEELPNGFVMKFTVATMQTPEGLSYEGTGLPPDVEVAMDPLAVDRVQHVEAVDARLAEDVQLRAAVNLLRMRP
jgi:carboxyl-terminal processing protease